MKKIILGVAVILFGLGITSTDLVQAQQIEVLRGEEIETEIPLEESEDVYSMLGELEGDGEFILLRNTEENNGVRYQVLEAEENGKSARLLLSARGEYNYGLTLRLRVEGRRIGTGTIALKEMQLTDKNGNWLQMTELPDITVNVLPNPLSIHLDGEHGNNGWFTSLVTATVEDKDAAMIWYNVGDGKKEYNGPFTIGNGETKVTVNSDDGYGYKKEETEWVYVDTVHPVLSVSMNNLDWQQKDIAVTAGSYDGTSGIAGAFWSFSDSEELFGEWKPLVELQELSMSSDGVWYLHLKASDYAGNFTQKVYGPYKKDSVQPEIIFENLYDSQLVEEEILPEITVTDECSGIKNIKYLLDGETWNREKITAKGNHTLEITAEDRAGNIRTETIEFSIYHAVTVTAQAGNCHYTGTASYSALVLYKGTPVEEAETEFFVNGESIGTRKTNHEGKAWMHLPMDLSPQKAEFTVAVSQDDNHFLLGAEDSDTFTIKPEKAWMLYWGDYHVWSGEPLRIYLEMGEIPDFRMGDITRAEVLVELYRIENDGSKTFVEQEYLAPDEWGIVTHEFYPDTGLYELRIGFTESSCYTGEEIVLHPAVFDIDAALDWDGGHLTLDLPQLGVYIHVEFTFLPPSLDGEVEVRIPGTGITLTENRITGYDLDTDGIKLYGKAKNPADGSTYCYEVRTEYTMGLLLKELETSVWKGEDKTKEPVYHFEWSE